MVPIKLIEAQLSRKNWSYLLLGLVSVGLVLPLLLSVIDLSANIDIPALNKSFAKILSRSIAFGLGQSLLSTLASCSLGALIGFLLCSKVKSDSLHIKFFRVCAMVLFVLPGSVIATISLSLLESFHLDFLPVLLQIVFAHTLWSTFFIAGQVTQKCIWFFNSQKGLNQFLFAHQSGLSRVKAAWVCLHPTIGQELKKWFPLIFCWSLTSFSTVLIIGNSPAHSTPEVLLYFTLSNDSSPARTLTLMLFNLLLQMWIFKKLFFNKPAPPSTQLHLNNPTGQTTPSFDKPIRYLFAFLPVGLLVWYFLPLLWGLIKGESLLLTGRQLFSLLEAAGFSILLGLSSCFFLLGLCLLLIRCRDDWRKPLVLIMGISPILLSGAWSSLGMFQVLWEQPLASLVFVAFLLALFQLPLSTLWIGEEQRHLSRRPMIHALNLGMPASLSFKEFYLPAILPVLRKILFFNFVLCLGELALSSFWLVRTPLLATWSHKLSAGYQFDEARSLVLLTLLLALAAYVILFRLTPRRRMT